MKIISKHEFSETLNISPYVYNEEATVSKQHIIYNLKGIVVH